ncbi:MAG: hypothetical protein ACKVU1_15655 [bacterium]
MEARSSGVVVSGFSPRYRQEDFAGVEQEELVRRYDEGRRRLAEIGAIVPASRDELLDEGDLWLQVAFLENVIRYEEEMRR